ncbi:MAG TPA: DUF87 domain-containing protein [Chloroflexia bacterium]
MLAVCVQPVHIRLEEMFFDGTLTGGVALPAAWDSSLKIDEREQPNLRTLLQVMRTTRTLEKHISHLMAIGQRAFNLRVQLAGAGPLGDSIVTTLSGEVTGVGLNTVEHVWRDPTSPLAAEPTWVRPRSNRLARRGRSEHYVALENLRNLAFTPWGHSDGQREHKEVGTAYLADLGEAARLFALPTTDRWIPRTSTALALPLAVEDRYAPEGLHLGLNRLRDTSRLVGLPAESRAHHLWVVGQTGTGKSTMIELMVLQDIVAGRGVIVVDPHGDLIEQVLGKLPRERLCDVVLFDPSDTEYPVGLNPLEASTEAEQAMVVSAFLGLLAKLYDPHQQGIVGPRFEHGARNGLLTIMSVPGNTLIELVRVMTDPRFVQQLLPHVVDPVVRRYWTDQIANTSDFHKSEVLDWIVSKFGRFVTDPTIRRIIGQSRSGFSLRAAMDEGKIVLLNLAKGRVGSQNATFLGLVLLPMILQAALSS